MAIAGGPVSDDNPTIPKLYAPATTPDGSPFDACNCTLTYTPVCAVDGQTYGNACIAKCMNQEVASPGLCKKCTNTAKGDCQCGGQPFQQVCVDGITYDTPCDAQCSGKNCFAQGPCSYTADGSSTFIPSTGVTTGSVGEAAANTVLPSPSAATSKDYGDALTKALLFYESQRSGDLPVRYLAWRSSSCLTCVGPGGEDQSGGFYEAGGSFLKLGLPSAYTVTNLAWGAAAFAEGYQRTNNTEHVGDLIKWGADFLVKSWNNEAQAFVAVLGNNTIDFNYYGPVEEYDQYNERPAFYINAEATGSEIAGEAAAALAAAQLSKASPTTDYLTPAEQLYTFATGPAKGSYMNTTSPGIQIHAALYPSLGFLDELAWAAAWLYKATNTTTYLTDARTYYNECCGAGKTGYTYEVGQKAPALHVLMSEIDPTNAATYDQNAMTFFNQYLTQSIAHTPKGLAYPFHWGAMRVTQSAAFLMLQYSQLIRASDAATSAKLFNYAQFQVDYALGNGGRSWVVGVGDDYPQHVWHKQSYASLINWDARGKFQWMSRQTGVWTSPLPPAEVNPVITMYTKFEMEGNYKPQPFIAYGALFAAPARDDSLVASRRDYTYAEPTTEGAGGFTGAVAALASYYTTSAPIDVCSLDLGWSHPNATIDSRAVCGAPATATTG